MLIPAFNPHAPFIYAITYNIINKVKTYKSLVREKVLTVSEGNSEFPKAKINKSLDAWKFALQLYKNDMEIFESFYVILLNIKNNTIGYALISQGGLTSIIVDVSIIFKFAIDTLAKSIILVHNHPSEELSPSDADKILTKRVQDGCKILDIKVLDHIIISKNNYFSFADEYLL